MPRDGKEGKPNGFTYIPGGIAADTSGGAVLSRSRDNVVIGEVVDSQGLEVSCLRHACGADRITEVFGRYDGVYSRWVSYRSDREISGIARGRRFVDPRGNV